MPGEDEMGEPPDWQHRVETASEHLGREAEAAGQRLGQEAEAAAERMRRDAGLVRTADVASRLWGLIVVAAGLWLFAQITLGLPVPAVAWSELWPVVLIAIGLGIVLRGLARRS